MFARQEERRMERGEQGKGRREGEKGRRGGGEERKREEGGGGGEGEWDGRQRATYSSLLSVLVKSVPMSIALRVTSTFQ